jgi:hypothetical protein
MNRKAAEIGRWINARYLQGEPGSPQREFRMVLNMLLQGGAEEADAVARATASVRSRNPGFVPEEKRRVSRITYVDGPS